MKIIQGINIITVSKPVHNGSNNSQMKCFMLVKETQQYNETNTLFPRLSNLNDKQWNRLYFVSWLNIILEKKIFCYNLLQVGMGLKKVQKQGVVVKKDRKTTILLLPDLIFATKVV